jgi:hypothetical protein
MERGEMAWYAVNAAYWGLLLALMVHCLFLMVGCGSTAEADQGGRFEYDRMGAGPYNNWYSSTYVLTDNETGQQWVVVTTEKGAAMSPLDDGEVDE